MEKLGVPYARVEFVDGLSFRICPECGKRFAENWDPEADMGCGAMVSDYAAHYEHEHEA